MYFYIKANAMRRNDLAGWIEDQTNPMIVNLACVWMFPNTRDTNHWRRELADKYSSMKFPTFTCSCFDISIY